MKILDKKNLKTVKGGRIVATPFGIVICYGSDNSPASNPFDLPFDIPEMFV